MTDQWVGGLVEVEMGRCEDGCLDVSSSPAAHSSKTYIAVQSDVTREPPLSLHSTSVCT